MSELDDLAAAGAAAVKPYKWAAIGIVLILLLVAAYLFGAHTSAPAPENTSPAAAQSQADGSVVLERTPDASAPAAAAKPKADIPKGATLERQVSVTVKPRASIKIPATATTPATTAECPPVTVDMSLIRQGDGRRVVASSPDGTVIGGLDVPIEAGVIPVSRPWAAGLSCEASRDCGKTLGVWVDRDLARIRFGAEVIKREQGGPQARIKVGWVW